MARFKTKVVPVGTHRPAMGEFKVDRARTQHWADQFREMKAAGIRIPLSWGHQPKAVPADEATAKADKEYWLSQYNAGYIEDASVDADGLLSIVADAPAISINDKGEAVSTARLPDGREVLCAIGEVSGAFRDFRDGKGRDWPDAMIHVAMTPLPVVAGQDGFTSLSSTDYVPFPNCEPAQGEVRLSLATHLAKSEEQTMASDTGGEGARGGKGGDVGNLEGGEGEGQGEGGEGSGAGGKKDRLMEKMQELSDALSTMGIMVEPGEDAETYLEHMLTAVNTHQATKEGAAGEGTGEETAEANSAATPPNPESPPMMMSLATIPADQTLSRALFIGKQRDERASLLKRIDALASRKGPGGLPAIQGTILEDWRKRAGAAELSLTAEAEVVQTELHRELSLAEKLVPVGNFTRGAKPVDSPLKLERDPAEDKAEAKRMVEKMGMGAAPASRSNGAA